MRSVICLIAALWAGAAGAQPEAGCYTRIYGERHMAENPGQVVAAMRLRFSPFDEDGMFKMQASLEAIFAKDVRGVFADQSQTAESGPRGKVVPQHLLCREEDDAAVCRIECDGGAFQILMQEDGVLEIQTDHLLIGEGDACEGYYSLDEEYGVATTYRLFRTADEACEGLVLYEP